MLGNEDVTWWWQTTSQGDMQKHSVSQVISQSALHTPTSSSPQCITQQYPQAGLSFFTWMMKQWPDLPYSASDWLVLTAVTDMIS